jgi:aminoglycoside phosphotransferase (APT) family kinase protein
VTTEPPPQPSLFSTDKIDFAAWLIAAGHLRFRSTDPGPRPRQYLFCFDDPEHLGAFFEMEYITGEPVAPVRKFVGAKLLLRKATDQLSGVTYVPTTR